MRRGGAGGGNKHPSDEKVIEIEFAFNVMFNPWKQPTPSWWELEGRGGFPWFHRGAT
jgi:hypothetical protein